MKTKKCIVKRLKVTARGKILRHHPGAGHLKSAKTQKQIRRFRKAAKVPKMFAKNARIMLGV
jgi:ribosomal protein L35